MTGSRKAVSGGRSYLPVVWQTMAATGTAAGNERHRWPLRVERLALAAQDFSNERDNNRLAQCIARHACELLNADYSAVRLYRQQHLETHVASRGSSPAAVEGWPRVEALVARVLKERVPQVEWIETQEGGDDLRSILVAPIEGLHRRVIGTIEWVNKKISPRFERDDVAVAECLARIASCAVDRARLFGHLHDWSRSLEMLLSFNAAVNGRLEPRRLVRQLLENATRFLKAEGGVVGLAIESAAGGGSLMQCEGRWLRGKWYDWPRQWRPEEGIPGLVLVSEFPYFASDYRHDPLADPQLAVWHDVVRGLCVPVKNAQGQVLGFFELHRGEDEAEFTWQDAAFLESLGNTAAVAIENARLLKSLEARNREIKRLSAEHLHRLEAERQHISRELHDEAGQALIGLKLGIQIVSAHLPPGADEARRQLDQLRRQLNESATRIKDLATRLRPPALDELGFEAAVRQLAMESSCRLGLDVAVQFAAPADLPAEVATSLFRITQEALTNVSKHAGVTACRVAFRVDHEIVLSIEDEGCGFDTSSPVDGLGLLGMKERVKMLRGRLLVESRIGRGTRLIVRIPRHAPDSSTAGGRS